MDEWITARRPRTGKVTVGKWGGDTLHVEPDDQAEGAWHLFLTGSSSGWDIFAEDASQLREWLDDPQYGFQLDAKRTWSSRCCTASHSRMAP
ncbi:hypothetical protein [Kineococcus sp. SYSU DK002]|uniref:hypothetical protein n=1 Tax=Kineococcus sp. SYSU DK002 TaxID=3383123 RepID=UPI003D7E93DA